MRKALLLVSIGLLFASTAYSETIEASLQASYEPEAAKSGYVLFIMPQFNFVDSEYTIPKVAISRAGYTVEVASTSTREIAIGADIMKVRPNLSIEQINTDRYKGVIYVGGYSSKAFFENKVLIDKTKEFVSKGVLIGSMDNVPYLMAKWGVLKGVKVTVNISLAKAIKSMNINYVNKDIVIDKNFITLDNQLYSDQFTSEFLNELDKR